MKTYSTISLLVISYATAATSLPWPLSRLISLEVVTPKSGILYAYVFPSVKETLPLYYLGPAIKFPDNKFYDILKSSSPDLNLTKQHDDTGDYYYDGDRLAGYYHNQSGETSVFPKLGSLQPGTLRVDTDALMSLVKDYRIVADDDTKYSIVIGSRLGGSLQKKGGKPSGPADYLLEGIIQRQAVYQGQNIPVCGPGSRGSFSFGSDGQIKTFTHRWSSAKVQVGSIAPLPAADVQKQIETQLLAANLTTNVTVRGVELCFFDSGNKYIQPVFRFNATVTQPFGLADEIVVGYVPAGGRELEALPTINSPAEKALPDLATSNGNSTITKRQPGTIRVGRYAMSHDQYSGQIVVDENAFLNGLLKSAPGRFLNIQYYWDEPLVYESPTAHYYVDAVNVAFTEGHGAVHVFTTNESIPGWGRVNIAGDLPVNGFGPRAGGSLAYWFIRACDTISTPIDYAAADSWQAFDPWWQVFNGMHAVLGYRTLAQVYDNEMGNVGMLLGKGAGVVHGWMKEALGGGKTSAVTVCGHDDDNIFQIDNTGPPNCLRIWWYS